jgi:hypothetical protein
MEVEDDLLVTPALGDTEEEGGFSENETVATLADESTGELDDKLDAFFGSDEDTEENLIESPVLEDSKEKVDDDLDNLPVDKEEIPETREETLPGENTMLLALAGGLAALASGSSARQIEENQELVRKIQAEPKQTTEQTVLLQLVSSVLTLVPGDSAELPTGTTELTEYLFEQLASQEISSDTLVAAIGRFTDWQKNLMQNILTSSQSDAGNTATTTPAPEDIAQVTSEVRSGFDTLRSTLQEEFISLRDELKQNR